MAELTPMRSRVSEKAPLWREFFILLGAGTLGVVAAESVVLLVALFSLWIIRRYRSVEEASP